MAANAVDVEDEDCLELEYDMWDGQFDFVGPQGVAQDRGRLSSSLSLTEDLFTGGPLSPHLHNGLNGGKKTPAHMWCENMSDQVQLLQQQVTTLADTQSTADDRYARAKADNAVLQARIHMLDEQIREIECRCQTQIDDEKKRCRDAISRVERDRDQQILALNERLGAAESEAGDLKQEVGRLRGIAEGLRMGAEAEARRFHDAQEQISELTLQLQQAREQERKQREMNTSGGELIAELQAEVERLRREQTCAALPTTQPDLLRLEELHRELADLRRQNKSLCEAQEELQAQILTRGIEEGRSLLDGVSGPLIASPADQHSLAHELGHMSQDQVQKKLQEQQDVNMQLRTYIDGILLSIVEHYPQLLDIKYQKRTPS